MKPTITILNRVFWPHLYGGLERVLWNAANTFADQSVEVRVCCESFEGAPDHQVVRDGLTIQRYAPVQFGRLWRIAELVQARWWKRIIASAPPSDWYWASEPTAAAAVIRAGLGHKLMYRPVFCFDGLTHVAKIIPEMAPLGRSLIARKLDRYAYKHAAVVIQQSHNIRAQHEHWYGTRHNSLVVPNATDATKPVAINRERFGLSANHFVIGFVGRPGDPCKDLPFLITALKAQALPDHARLLIVGGGAGFESAQTWIKHAGLAPHTIWTGELSDPAPAYAAMNALVLPSRFETFGNVIIEAHAHGLPALARAANFDEDKPVFTASAELIDSGVTGYVVDSHDPAELGAKLALMAANPAMAKEMGRVAKQRTASYTRADAADRYLQAMGLPTRQSMPARRAA
jgi:glycosyltransferase involved in cell wall biosynthesis